MANFYTYPEPRPTVEGLEGEPQTIAQTQFEWHAKVALIANEECTKGIASTFAAPDVTATITGPLQYIPDFGVPVVLERKIALRNN